MKIFGIDPGSNRTGYGCIDYSGSQHRLVTYGAIATPPRASFPEKLRCIHSELVTLLATHQPACVAVESLFHARNVQSALKLGHARGVAVLAAAQAGVTLVEYTPSEIKSAVVGSGRAEKQQVQRMIKLLLELDDIPTPHDAADALAVAICHAHQLTPSGAVSADSVAGRPKQRSWRKVKPENLTTRGPS
ncbi:MAG: crossover junction endodeoxyribonuclease RuvC [Acidobacteriota bacterium]|nr:crossover junction endodeoxyribonuclease RuvC [Acidobacteriota bacterium]